MSVIDPDSAPPRKTTDPLEVFHGTSRYARPRTQRERILLHWLWVAVDLLLISLSVVLVAFLTERSLGWMQWTVLGGIAVVQLAVHFQRGLYHAVLRYVGIHELSTIGGGMVLGIIGAVVTCYFLDLPNTGGVGRIFLILHAFVTIALLTGARLAHRLTFETTASRSGKRVLVFGSGSLGEVVMRELHNQPGFQVVGFLDLNAARHGQRVRGCKVYGDLGQLSVLHNEKPIDLLVIAERMMSQQALKKAFQLSMELGIQVKRVQGVAMSRSQPVQLQDLALEELLARPQRNLDRSSVRGLLSQRTVLITGAGGSIGSELCRQIASAGAKHLVLVDHSEFNLYQIDGDLAANHPECQISPVLATLADRATLDVIIANHKPDLVFHAAAYKHVPMVEENPFLGMTNNLGGFRNLLESCIAHKVPQVVAISTDKAVRPTNVMGASKRACEVLLQNIDAGETRLCAVRFGNVLGSSGSVIPRFLEQIRRGGPVTVTDPEVTRYFMLLPEAVELVLQAAAVAKHGEILILDMGEPVKIVNLARQLIFMTGHRPEVDIRISFTGLRPGEKLTEELLLGDSEASTVVDGITIATATRRDRREVSELVDRLLSACLRRDLDGFFRLVRQLVPEWQPSREFAAIVEGTTDQFPTIGQSGNDSAT
jgi:FlaA1/EpsC-like NDP-sugar epimerase